MAISCETGTSRATFLPVIILMPTPTGTDRLRRHPRQPTPRWGCRGHGDRGLRGHRQGHAARELHDGRLSSAFLKIGPVMVGGSRVLLTLRAARRPCGPLPFRGVALPRTAQLALEDCCELSRRIGGSLAIHAGPCAGLGAGTLGPGGADRTRGASGVCARGRRRGRS
jgi:hypothetical protein